MSLYNSDFETVDQFKIALKSWRGNKDWIFYVGNVNGNQVRLKTYGHTYMQIFQINGRNQHMSPMDCTVKAFNDAIAKGFDSAVQS